ncbi:hypothetical protein PHMEG_00028896 [Phytophthora megakarya]|uniref:Uncharacterized protein n=1 Tax=Phytophthora megakarya TaxID=4795 RepID=A0A225V513_9STRA|nr:hypothetical protein PHMEG_00028896 [Phytophthora megakarya]
MASKGKNVCGLDSFKGKSYMIWKDKLMAYINTQDQLYKCKRLEKGLPTVRVLMSDFLQGSPEQPPTPDFFLSTLPASVSRMEPREMVNTPERDYGQKVTARIIDLTRAWSKLTKSQWPDVRTFLANRKMPGMK